MTSHIWMSHVIHHVTHMNECTVTWLFYMRDIARSCAVHVWIHTWGVARVWMQHDTLIYKYRLCVVAAPQPVHYYALFSATIGCDTLLSSWQVSGVLQRVATCCSVVQCVAVCCRVLQCGCSVLQCATVCYSVLPCVAGCIPLCALKHHDRVWYSPFQLAGV